MTELPPIPPHVVAYADQLTAASREMAALVRAGYPLPVLTPAAVGAATSEPATAAQGSGESVIVSCVEAPWWDAEYEPVWEAYAGPALHACAHRGSLDNPAPTWWVALHPGRAWCLDCAQRFLRAPSCCWRCGDPREDVYCRVLLRGAEALVFMTCRRCAGMFGGGDAFYAWRAWDPGAYRRAFGGFLLSGDR